MRDRTLTFTVAEMKKIITDALMFPSDRVPLAIERLDNWLNNRWEMQEYRRNNPKKDPTNV